MICFLYLFNLRLDLFDSFKTINNHMIMNSNNFYKIFFALVFALNTTNFAFCQKASFTGLTFTSELTQNNDFRVGAGFTFERQMTTHLGFETGLFYRTDKREFQLTFNETNYLQSLNESYLSLPLLLKFYSRFLNVSIGPSLDYFVGWRETSSYSNVEITSYKVRPLINIGIMGKISKVIVLTDKIILEPEIRFNPLFKPYRYYAGIGIGLKYKL